MTRDLLVRLPNWVGDVCMALPSLRALIDSGFDLTCFGKSWAPELLSSLPVECRSVPPGILASARATREFSGKDILIFPRSFSTAASAYWSGLKGIGHPGDLRSLLLKHRLPSGRYQHESERFWHLSKQCCELLTSQISAFPEEVPKPSLPASRSQVAEADALLKNVSDRFLVLCPLAVGTIDGKSKQWPGFEEVARELGRKFDLVCCPGPQEEETCSRLLPQATLLPEVKLGVYAAIMRKSRGVLSNDSGPGHLAAAAGASTLVVFGVSDPSRYAPRGAHFIGSEHAWPTTQAAIDRLLEISAGGGITPG